MRVWIFTILWASALGAAADEQRLALALKAQTDLDRVELAAVPQLRDAVACVQSQASLLPIAMREELPLIHYHKGYCALLGATITHNSGEFRAAAEEFDKAVESWPARALVGARNGPQETVSSGLRMLAAIARMEASGDDAARERARQEITFATESPACFSSVMAPKFCEAVLATGRQWLGWMALGRDRLDEASRDFASAPESGWPAWVAGRKAFAGRAYRNAAGEYRRAIDTWTSARQETAPSFTARLSPPPDMAAALADLGGAQLLAGDAAAAIATLDAAIKLNQAAARAYYLRARAHELAGQAEAALADYNMASRNAFASAQDLASGEAHLYRGMSLFRRKDYRRAEDEFASALNFEIPAALRGDAVAWRHLAAVAGGSCRTSREYLEQSLAAVSPYFPKEEARTLSAACATTVAAGPVGAAK
ncbi:MAG: hypothetical protein LAP87_24655 [Acidobacteriia bacterium]|nr:hypothetical protein [Terriglobia bacterium]